MTENKRFTYSKCEIFDNGEHFAYACSEYNAEDISNKLNELAEKNKQLKKRNENQYRQLQHLWSLMEAKDWETLSKMVNQMEEDEKRLQQEWKCYE